MKQIISRRTFALTRWVCVCVIICSQLSLFALNVAAQEPTTEPTSLPTPTPAATWTPTPAPGDTPMPGATPTATSSNPTATSVGRLVDFRADDDEIDKGDCVMFSWVVRGDIDRVEFDKREDDRDPVLVSNMDSREECPDGDTDYDLIVRWLDGTQTTRSIEIEVDADSDGSDSNSGGGGAATPSGVGVFVNVTPILITDTLGSVEDGALQQASYQDTSGGVGVTPGGVLGSVKVLPETGYLSPLTANTVQSENNFAAVQPDRGSWPMLAGGLGIFLGIVIIGLTLGAKVIRESEASR